ncbi:MAG: glycosyltransferase [Acidobacteria bacterium]|nr:glycosyltransferase [Acidobacteriota bacterium]
MTEVAIVILDLDGGEMLERCLDSLERQTLAPKRVVIFDNGSVDPVAGRLRPASLPIEIIRNDRNIGFARGADQAIRATSEPYVALINNDVVLEPQWLENLAGRLEERDDLAAVQSLNLQPDGMIDGAGIAPRDGRIVQAGHGSPLESFDCRFREIWGVSATAALYRRGALESVRKGGEIFLGLLETYYEDVELAARLRREGWKAELLDEPLAVHIGSGSEVKLAGRAVFLRTRNRYFIARIHHGVGNIPALLSEDFRAIVRSSARLHARSVIDRIRGIVSGLSGTVAARM